MEISIQELRTQSVGRIIDLYGKAEAQQIFNLWLEARYHMTVKDQVTTTTISWTEKQQGQWTVDYAALFLGTPLQYVLGEAYFLDHRFDVGPGVLIPRPETEELVDLIYRENTSEEFKPSLLDIGTGSGIIPISLERKFASSNRSGRFFGLDFSEDALHYAIKNKEKFNSSVFFIEHNIFNALEENESAANLLEALREQSVNIIVSNPPYVTEKERKEMSSNVLDYEPNSALFVPNENALKFYKRITELAFQYLPSDGKLYFEINEKKGKQVHALVEGIGFTSVTIHKDIHGKERMLSATRK